MGKEYIKAVLEVITNATGGALTFLAHQQTQMRNVTYQNTVTLQYLPATEGGVYRKFSLADCCIQIDDQPGLLRTLSNE